MRDALSIFDQVSSFGNGKITYQNVIDNLNVLDYDYYFKLTEAFLIGDLSSALLLFNDVLNNGFEGQHFITGLSAHFRDLLVCKDPATITLLEVGAGIRTKYLEQAAKCPPEFLFMAIKISNDCDLDYRESKNKRLLVELALIRITQLSDSKKKIRELIFDEIPIPIQPFSFDLVLDEANAEIQTPPTAGTIQSKVIEPTTGISKTDVSKSTPPPSPKEEDAPRLIKSIKTSSIRKQVKKVDAVVQQEASTPTFNQSFTAEALISSWNRFSDLINKDVHLKNAMKASLPVLQADNVFEIVVQNQVQEMKLLEIARKIETHLQNELKNSQIKMQLRMAETGENVRPFTAKDRLEVMKKKNPNLDLLYRTFGLEMK